MRAELLVSQDEKYKHVIIHVEGTASERDQVLPLTELLTVALKEDKEVVVIRKASVLERNQSFDVVEVDFLGLSRFSVLL